MSVPESHRDGLGCSSSKGRFMRPEALLSTLIRWSMWMRAPFMKHGEQKAHWNASTKEARGA